LIRGSRAAKAKCSRCQRRQVQSTKGTERDGVGRGVPFPAD